MLLSEINCVIMKKNKMQKKMKLKIEILGFGMIKRI